MSGLTPFPGAETESLLLHRASWLIPVSSLPIADGAVLVRNGTILAKGPYRELAEKCPVHARIIDHEACALIPALVNAHTHLELTCLENQIPLPQKSFASWLLELFQCRSLCTVPVQRQALLQGVRRLRETGTGLYGDVTNGTSLQVESPFESKIPSRQVFLELLGFDQDTLESAMEPDILQVFRTADHKDHSLSLAAHACYSTSGEIIRKTKEWCRNKNIPFSIHAAEHEDEVQFLRDGTGFCREVLESLNKWVPHWSPPGMSPVEYLDRLNVLDGQTLIVHAVYMSETDWEIVAKRKSAVCFCPRSNRNLNIRHPDIEEALHRGIVSALGTDSLASNTDLDLFKEAAYVLDHYPGLRPDLVLSLVTLGGAKALHRQAQFGSIEPGKQAALLAVHLDESLSPTRLIETLIHHGAKGDWQWAQCP